MPEKLNWTTGTPPRRPMARTTSSTSGLAWALARTTTSQPGWTSTQRLTSSAAYCSTRGSATLPPTLLYSDLDFLQSQTQGVNPMAKTIGIDLGTTNSCMAVLEGGEPTVIPNAEGGRTTPSVVAFTKDGQRLVGPPAKRQQVTNPSNTIFSIKRFMGRKFEEVSEEMKIVPYEVVQGPNGDVRVKAEGKEYAPPEISAMILQKLKTDAEAYLGESVADAVV